MKKVTTIIGILITTQAAMAVGPITGTWKDGYTMDIVGETVYLNKLPSVAIHGHPKIGYGRFEGDIRIPDYPYSDEQLKFMAESFVRTRALEKDVIERLKKFNPDIPVTKYMGSTYTSQSEPDKIERDYLPYIAMCPAAVLTENVTTEATEFTVAPYSFPKNETTEPYFDKVIHTPERWQEKDSRIRTLNDLIPITASTTNDRFTKNSKAFIFVIRIGDEVMRVKDWDAASCKIKIIRGYAGTKKLSHKEGDVVTSPIFCGIRRPYPPGFFTAGKMKQGIDNAGSVTYCMGKMKSDAPIWKVKGDFTVDAMLNEGYDGVNMDVTSGRLPMFNMVNLHGLQTVPWNFEQNRPYTQPEMVKGHDRVCGYLHQYVYNSIGRYPVISANGVVAWEFEKEDGSGAYCKQLIIPTPEKPIPLWSYSSEAGVAVTGGRFPAQFRMLQIGFQEAIGVEPEMKAAGLALSQEWYDEMMHYSAAMMYMAYEPRKEGWSLEKDGPGVQVRSSFLSPYFHMPSIGKEWKHPHSGKMYKFNLPYTFYLPLGKPLKSGAPGDLEAYQYKDTPLLVREFENGLVILNPTGGADVQGINRWRDVDAAIDKELFEEQVDMSDLNIPRNGVIKLDREYLDPETGKKISGELIVPYSSGKILLKKGDYSGTVLNW